MVTWVHIYLAATNLFGLIPFFGTRNMLDKCVVAATVFASSAMHISETKHSLLPHPYIANKAELFLNMDRGAGIVCTLLYFPRWWMSGTWNQAAIFLFGLAASGLGEVTTNVPAYCILHTIWHFCAYVTMYSITR